MQGNKFRVGINALADILPLQGEVDNPIIPVKIDLVVPFKNLIICRDSMFPKPNSIKDAIDIAEEFIDTKNFCDPIFNNGTYSFVPKVD